MDFPQKARKVEAEYQRLKGQVKASALTREEAEAQLKDLMIQDDEDRWWIIGYETGKWYYHDGEKWVQAELPKPTPPALPHLAKLPSAPSLFQEESFLLHFLPTLAAAGIVELPGFSVPPFFFYGRAYPLPFFLSAVVTFGLWLVLRQKVIHKWLMILTLSVSYSLAGLVYDYFLFRYWFLTPWLILFAIVSALGYGLSFVFAMLLRARPASKQ